MCNGLPSHSVSVTQQLLDALGGALTKHYSQREGRGLPAVVAGLPANRA